ncbi:Meiotically up-regulated protein [Tolypocladium ophioglossoides CBS 100239]|uniref:Meiotically up-regulated protein n=1 Tax=Tolypocladium ophioglossoides (strain CBS 100239) TaxID=1163406 RepID=A0A0L0NHI5_TOLOC|nr:Meiotically up-regulated protein [Tolypocladium ophioglossoides CBS 100239]
MSTPVKSTPVKSTPVKASPATDSPGTWRHPRLDEITRRRNATTFSEKNIRQIAYNAAALLALWSIQLIARLKVDPQILSNSARSYLSWAWFILQLVPFVQIGTACLPLVRAKDDLSDIPLTATQRKLLGLPPSSAPPTPDAKYSTPPRYSRTPSIAGSVGSRGSYNSSPLSGRGSPAPHGSVGGSPSPYSPVGSPMFQKSLSGLVNGRRSSFGSTSPFGASSSANLFSDSASPSSPSPSGGKRTSVGLNSKSLYEKGRRSSGSAWLH